MQRGGVLPALEVSRASSLAGRTVLPRTHRARGVEILDRKNILLNCYLNLKLGYSCLIGLYLRQTKILMFTQVCNYVRRAGVQGIPHMS